MTPDVGSIYKFKDGLLLLGGERKVEGVRERGT